MEKEYINMKELTQDNAKTLYIFTGHRGNNMSRGNMRRGFYTFLSEDDAKTWAQALHGTVESQFISIDGKLYHIYVVGFWYEDMCNG